jgi:hypothetical protein
MLDERRRRLFDFVLVGAHVALLSGFFLGAALALAAAGFAAALVVFGAAFGLAAFGAGTGAATG